MRVKDNGVTRGQGDEEKGRWAMGDREMGRRGDGGQGDGEMDDSEKFFKG